MRTKYSVASPCYYNHPPALSRMGRKCFPKIFPQPRGRPNIFATLFCPHNLGSSKRKVFGRNYSEGIPKEGNNPWREFPVPLRTEDLRLVQRLELPTPSHPTTPVLTNHEPDPALASPGGIGRTLPAQTTRPRTSCQTDSGDGEPLLSPNLLPPFRSTNRRMEAYWHAVQEFLGLTLG